MKNMSNYKRILKHLLEIPPSKEKICNLENVQSLHKALSCPTGANILVRNLPVVALYPKSIPYRSAEDLYTVTEGLSAVVLERFPELARTFPLADKNPPIVVLLFNAIVNVEFKLIETAFS